MKKILTATAMLLLFARSSSAQYCSNCILNSPSAQNAQFNVSSATVRGQLTVGQISMSTGVFSSTATAATFIGSGTYLTALNASNITSGSLSTTTVSGNYYGITGVGALSTGTWNGNIITSQYGGTGSNLTTASQGSLVYFAPGSTMTVLPPSTAGYLLQTGGSNANPAWTGSPQVLGTNITSIPMANVQIGSIPVGWLVSDVNISTLSAAKVIGSIPGNSANINGKLALTQLSTGTLVNTIVASSITVTGVAPGYWGGPNELVLENVGTDGRIVSISQSSFTIFASSIAPGPLPPGVTISPSQVTSGTFNTNTVASSITVTGVQSGSYGYAAQVSTFTVGTDGRLTVAGNIPIALPLSQLNNGTLPSGVLVPAANVQSGLLGSGVIASSLAVNGVPPGSYGGIGNTVLLSISGNGLITSATTYGIPGVSTNTAVANVDNNWSHSQTFQASVTVNSNLLVTSSVTAGQFYGSGAGLNSLTPSNINAGTLNSNVIASSVTLPFLVLPGSVTASAFVGSGAYLTGVLNTSVYNVFTASQQFNGAGGIGVQYGISAGSVTTTSSVTASAFFGNGSNLTGIVASSAAVHVTASMYGDGTLGNPLGVASSSVAVLSSGYVLESQLNPANTSTLSMSSLKQVTSAVTATSSMTNTSQGGGLFTSSVTASYFVGNGSLLTNVATNKSGFLSASNATLGVGTFAFGYINQAVTISSVSVIITASGSGGSSGTIWACCYGGSCVSVTSSQGAAVGSTFTGNGSVAVLAGGQLVLQMTSSGESVTPTVNTICGYQ